MTGVFVLDEVDNPHPRMRETALQLRRSAKVSGDPILGSKWLGYLDCMCDATGENAAAINAWLDRFDDPALVPHIVTNLPEPGVRRR